MGTDLVTTTNPLELPPEAMAATKALVDNANSRQLPISPRGELEGYWDPASLSDEYDNPKLVPLRYDEGFPTIEDTGVPFWERLENEPPRYYEAFKRYRDYPYTTVTAANASQASNLTKNRLAQHKKRTLAKTAELLRTSSSTLATLAALYYWQYRASAYDRYRDEEAQIQLRADAVEMELTHAGIARRLLDKVTSALDEMEPEELTPQMMVEWLKSGVHLERLSRGKDPSKPASGSQGDSFGNDARQKNGVSIGTNQGTVQVQVIHTEEWRSS
jgi:hypothetical protein